MQRRWSQALSSGTQWQGQRHWAQTGTQEVLSEYQETLFYWDGTSAGTDCPERSSHPLRYSKAVWMQSWTAWSSRSCLGRGDGQEGPASLTQPVFLCKELRRQMTCCFKISTLLPVWHLQFSFDASSFFHFRKKQKITDYSPSLPSTSQPCRPFSDLSYQFANPSLGLFGCSSHSCCSSASPAIFAFLLLKLLT